MTGVLPCLMQSKIVKFRPNALQNQAVTTTAKDLSFNVTAYTDALGKVSTNDAFTKIFKAFDGVQTAGSQKKKVNNSNFQHFQRGLKFMIL